MPVYKYEHKWYVCCVLWSSILFEGNPVLSFVFIKQAYLLCLKRSNSNYYTFIYFCMLVQVLVEGRAKSRAAILNRPSALNALTTSMVCASFYFLFVVLFEKFWCFISNCKNCKFLLVSTVLNDYRCLERESHCFILSYSVFIFWVMMGGFHLML